MPQELLFGDTPRGQGGHCPNKESLAQADKAVLAPSFFGFANKHLRECWFTFVTFTWVARVVSKVGLEARRESAGTAQRVGQNHPRRGGSRPELGYTVGAELAFGFSAKTA